MICARDRQRGLFCLQIAPPLQATAQPIPVMIGMTALHLFEHRDRPQAGMRLEQRTDLAVP